MKIIRTANELKPADHKVCLAIGFFDGVHLGHLGVFVVATSPITPPNR